MAEDLTTPRMVYRGAAPPKGAGPDPVETLRVEDKAALDKALKEGWRLHRDVTPAVKPAAPKPPVPAAPVSKPAEHAPDKE